jgi:tetratricopeptide (TPR) repeat protein
MQSRDTWANLAQAHLALARVWENILDFTHAGEEYEQALALAPGNAEVLRVSSSNATYMGHFEAALAAARRSVALDPLARTSHSALGRAVYLARHYEEAVIPRLTSTPQSMHSGATPRRRLNGWTRRGGCATRA